MKPGCAASGEEIVELTSRIEGGEPRALARGLTWIENDDARALQLLSGLSPRESSYCIGITGAPGVGKSSVAAAMIGLFRQKSERVAVLAIDPTSPLSGGALLGDRVRMRGHEEDPDVFIRSLASRGGSGGLSGCCAEARTLLGAAGFGTILLETVGVGQLEIEVVEEADLVVLILSPESGDTIQLLKGGIMEVVDLVVVNKSDRPGADELLRVATQVLEEGHGCEPLGVSAQSGDGFEALMAAIEGLRQDPDRDQDSEKDRRRVRRILQRRSEETWLATCRARAGGQERIDELVAEIRAGRLPLIDAVAELRSAGLGEIGESSAGPQEGIGT